MLFFIGAVLSLLLYMEIVYIPPQKEDNNVAGVTIDAELVNTDLDNSSEYNGIMPDDTPYNNDFGFYD